MTLRQGYRGYCTHNTFGEYRMPVPAQNILYRDYANKHNLYHKLTVHELFFPECFLNLWGLFKEIDQLEGVLMCSIFMLPPTVRERARIYQSLLDGKAELHFVLEGIILRTRKDIESLETIFHIRNQMPSCLTSEQLLGFLYPNPEA
jgi:sporadic carbohydrate cluster protein (TIGR04323 family)